MQPPLELGNGQISVTVRRGPFGIQVRNAAGTVVLDSLEGAEVAGDDVGVYRGLGVTHRAVTFAGHRVEGWDYQTAVDRDWVTTSRVTSTGTVSATRAELVLGDGSAKAEVRLTIELEGSTLKLDAMATGKAAANATSDRSPPGINTIGLPFQLPADEHFFGLGERLVSVDHRGRHYTTWVEEGGIGQGERAQPGPANPAPNGPGMTHAPVPFLLSTRGYGMWLDTSYRAGFVMGADAPSVWRVYVTEPALHLRLYVHDEPAASLADFTAATGRARLPAPWVFGPRRRVDRTGMVGGVLETQALRDQGVPTTMVDDTLHFLPIGSQVGQEAAVAAWTAEMHAQGYKAIAYYNAYVSVTDARAADLVAEGRSKGYFVKLDDGTEFDTFMISAGPQTVATIDMTNPAAVTWYGSVLQRALDLGYDGWMLDFGEYLPPNARMADGRSGWAAHNSFPVDYQKATFDYLRRVKGDEFMFFARAGYTGSAAVIPVLWSGDPAASFDDAKGLPSSVRAGINAGLSGFPFWGSDISGYTCLNDPPADKEVYLRWAEFGALSTDMHDENACSGSDLPKWTLWSDAETTRVYGDFARLHTRLFPYTYAAAKVATESGLPVMRHPVLVHPREPEAWKSEFDFWYGPALYVAPVVRRGATTREVWLPPGRWVDWFSLEPLAGGARVTRPAPLTALPLFLRSGGIVPLLDPSIQTLAPATAPAVVDLADVAGILDVRAAIDAGTGSGSLTLVDGSQLEVRLGAGAGAPALPADVAAAAGEAELATCASCGRIEPGPAGVTRVRISKQLAGGATVTAGGLQLVYAGAAARVRWDVAVLAP